MSGPRRRQDAEDDPDFSERPAEADLLGQSQDMAPAETDPRSGEDYRWQRRRLKRMQKGQHTMRNGLGFSDPEEGPDEDDMSAHEGGTCPTCGRPMQGNAPGKPRDNHPPRRTYGGESLEPGEYLDESEGHRDPRDYEQGPPYDNGSPGGRTDPRQKVTTKPNPFRRRQPDGR